MTIEKLTASTALLVGNFDRDAHTRLWEMIASTLSKHLTPATSAPVGLLPVARFVSGLPRNYFFRKSNFNLSWLIENTITAHAENGITADWWTWHESLSDTLKTSHDSSLIERVIGSSSRGDVNEHPKPKSGVTDYLPLTEVFMMVPHHRPVGERLHAVLREFNPNVPAAISVLHQFRYFSTEEVLANADQLATALPGKNSRKWFDLAHIADVAKRSDLAVRFRERANAISPK